MINSEKKIYKVEVLMSTYNGKKYLIEQIKSIFNQDGVDIHLLIRDDGSIDDTVSVIKMLQKKYNNKISLVTGKNVGYRKSFLDLFNYVKEADYYAYADQDDVWNHEKLIRAINQIKNDRECWLYSSALTIVDENLTFIREKKQTNVKCTLPSFFIRTKLAGCTYIFKPELCNTAKRFSNIKLNSENMPDHDCLMCMLCMLYDKKIYIDENSYILHRRQEQSETAGKGIRKRISVERKRIFNRKNCYRNTARILLDEITNIENKKKGDNLHFLNKVAQYKNSIAKRSMLIFDFKFTCGNVVADILIRIKVLLGYY